MQKIVKCLFIGLVLLWNKEGIAQNSTPSYISLTWTNDFFYFPNPTDYYYSNGLALEFSFPWLAENPINFLFPGRSNSWQSQFSFTLQQNLFTPINKNIVALVPNDRPFASYLFFDFGKKAVQSANGRKLTTHLQLGVLGRYSGGAAIQNWIHRITPQNKEVVGWVNEVKPDVVFNYNIFFEQALIRNKFFQLRTGAEARIGSLFIDLTPGFSAEISNMLDYFNQPLAWGKSKKLRLALYAESFIRAIAYDATLSGGVFNHDDRYLGKIQPSHWQAIFGTGLRVSWAGMGIKAGLRWTTPEFEGAITHGYGFVGLQGMW